MVFQSHNGVDHLFEAVANAKLHDLVAGLLPRVGIFPVAGQDELAIHT